MHEGAFTPENAAMLLIDHQVGTISWTRSHDVTEVKKSAILLARMATALGMPLVLTSSMEDQAQGPLLRGLRKVAAEAFARRIRRAGIVNAMHDDNFKAAVQATGRHKLVVAGITTEICVVFPVLQLLDAGYHVQVVADACASSTRRGDQAALRRMEQAGAVIVSSSQVASELAIDWSTPRGKAILGILARGQPLLRAASLGLRWVAAMGADRAKAPFRGR